MDNGFELDCYCKIAPQTVPGEERMTYCINFTVDGLRSPLSPASPILPF